MRRRPLAVVLPVLVADLALSTQASAGPPASCFRAKTRCDLTYYEATQTFKQKVSQKRRPRLTVAALTAVGVSAGCGPTKHRSPGFARCTITIEGGGLPAPCRIEAEYDSLAPPERERRRRSRSQLAQIDTAVKALSNPRLIGFGVSAFRILYQRVGSASVRATSVYGGDGRLKTTLDTISMRGYCLRWDGP